MAALDWVYQARAESLLSVDDLVGNLINTLTATNQLNNTYVVFTSDNGYHLGQFRLAGGKQSPYEEDVHLPLFIRGPGIAPGITIPHLVANIDIAPTFAELAGLSLTNTSVIPTSIDGRSFKSVLLSGGASISTDAHRQAFLIEKVIDGDDAAHIPTPFVRFTEGNQSADLWPNWRSYPDGGNPDVLSILGRGSSAGAPLAQGFSVNGAPVPFSINLDPYGVSPLLADQTYLTPLFDYSSSFTSNNGGNSPAWSPLGWSAGSFGSVSGPGGQLAVAQAVPNSNGTLISFTGEALATTLAVALAGYGNNKGAGFQDLYANFLSANSGGPVDALGNGILGALNVAGASEGSTWFWGAPYAAAFATYPNGTRIASTTNVTAGSAASSAAKTWLVSGGFNAGLNGAPNPYAGLANAANAAAGAFGGVDPFGINAAGFGNSNLKVDYQTVQGFNYPSPYYAIRVISSRYNLKYIEFPTGVELYDFSGSVSGTPDPWEINNVYSLAPPALKLLLASNLEQLKICKGNGNLAGAPVGPNSLSCLLANVPGFTAGGSAVAPPPSTPAALLPCSSGTAVRGSFSLAAAIIMAVAARLLLRVPL